MLCESGSSLFWPHAFWIVAMVEETDPPRACRGDFEKGLDIPLLEQFAQLLLCACVHTLPRPGFAEVGGLEESDEDVQVGPVEALEDGFVAGADLAIERLGL